MKQYITTDDLKTLSSSQMIALNSLWLPDKYDHVVAKVCVDAENDTYEDIEFVVGDIIINQGSQIMLRRLRIIDEIPEEYNEDEDQDNPEDEISDEDEDFEIDFNDPGDYFMKEDCLPLLSIGQLISFLRNTKAGQNGFSIGIPPKSDTFDEQYFTLDDRFGEVAKSEELTDLIFDMLKTML